MNKIYFATTNKGKIDSLNKDFEGTSIKIVPVEIEIPEPRSDETKIIAEKKVKYAFAHIKKPCCSLDGGFYIPSLNGFPKAYVNFALATIGIEGILKLIEGKDRSCYFVDTLAYLDKTSKEPVFFESIAKGVLAKEPLGKLQPHNWGELHKIFIPQGHTKTFAQMSAEEYYGWRKEISEEREGKKFAKWILKNKK